MNPLKNTFESGCLIAIIAFTLTNAAPPLLRGQETASSPSQKLRDSAQSGDLSGVRRAIDAKADINAVTEYGVTALSMASDHGHESIVRFLLEQGADPNTKDRFYKISPLGWAVSRRHVAIVGLLIDAGATEVDSALEGALGIKNEEMVARILASKKVSEKALIASMRSAIAMKSTSIEELLSKNMSEEAKAAARKESTSAPSDLTEYLGIYQGPNERLLTITLTDNQLMASEKDQERSTPLTLSQPDQLASRGLTVQVVRENNKIVSLKWLAGERETIFMRRSDASTTITAPTKTESSSKNAVALREDYSFDSRNWPQFRGWMSRGIGATMVDDGANSLPDTWDGDTMSNIAWKCPIPGLGTSSPIVWGNQVFMTTAVREGDTQGFRVGPYGDVESVPSTGECQFLLLSIAIDSGKELWRKELNRSVPKVKRHAKSSHANPTPATDGKHIVASFAGDGIYCCNMDGEVLWTQQLGMLDSGWFYDKSYQWGFGSSPCIFEDMVILQCDCQEGSFVTALDIATGVERWRTTRDEIPTWGSPVAFVTDDGTPTVIVSGTKCSAAYNARSGRLLWELGGFSEIVVPTPQVTRDLAVICSGYAPARPIVALRHGTHGALKIPAEKQAESPFAWTLDRAGPYMPTPLIHKNQLFVLENSGILSCYALGNGQQIFKQRVRSDLANAYTASPVAQDGKIYMVSESGLTFVVAMDSDGTLIAKNAIGESVLASPAIAQGKLLLRGEKNLFAITKKP